MSPEGVVIPKAFQLNFAVTLWTSPNYETSFLNVEYLKVVGDSKLVIRFF